ncbi:MAG: enoyl-CoA hydratase-related protein [Pseudomonadales bacterium]|nr:enoyl-CoA hydratase-related protein [Pseudomonadales bacterium]
MPALHTKTFETLKLSLIEKGILLVELHRPQVSNALNTTMAQELLALWQTLYVDAAPYRVVVLTGAGHCFCAGADLKERHGISAELWLQQHAVLEQMMLAMHACPLPLIAAVNGAAFGGGLELLLNCDFAYCCHEARFAFPETTLGFIPGAMGTQWLPRAVGLARAKELCLTGTPFTAADALAWGLVNRVISPDTLLDTVMEVAGHILRASPLAVRQVKQALDASQSSDLIGGYKREIELYRRCIHAADRVEGIAAFNEKRKPRFGDDR